MSNTPLRSASRTTGTTSPPGVSTATPMWKYFLRIMLSPDLSSEELNCGILPQRGDAGLDHEGEHRQLEALLLGLDGLRLAEGLEVGDVGLVELRDVRDRDPVAVQVGPGELLDARQRLRLDRAELGEVDLRPRRQVERQRAALPALDRGRGAFLTARPLTKPCTSACRMRPFGPLPCTRARSTPSSRANLRTEGLACGLATRLVARLARHRARRAAPARPARRRRRRRRLARRCARLRRCLRRASFDSSTRIGAPLDTLSPTLTFISFTTPAAGDGISIVALSDSSVMSDCSLVTASPGFTSTSITSTSLKSPMSGTGTVMAPPPPGFAVLRALQLLPWRAAASVPAALRRCPCRRARGSASPWKPCRRS